MQKLLCHHPATLGGAGVAGGSCTIRATTSALWLILIRLPARIMKGLVLAL